MREWSKQISKHSALHEVYVEPIEKYNPLYESIRVLTGQNERNGKRSKSLQHSGEKRMYCRNGRKIW